MSSAHQADGAHRRPPSTGAISPTSLLSTFPPSLTSQCHPECKSAVYAYLELPFVLVRHHHRRCACAWCKDSNGAFSLFQSYCFTPFLVRPTLLSRFHWACIACITLPLSLSFSRLTLIFPSPHLTQLPLFCAPLRRTSYGPVTLTETVMSYVAQSLHLIRLSEVLGALPAS